MTVLEAIEMDTARAQLIILATAQLVIVAIGVIKFVRHISRMEERFESIYQALVGDGPGDPGSFFHRFGVIEERVGQLWERRSPERNRVHPS